MSFEDGRGGFLSGAVPETYGLGVEAPSEVLTFVEDDAEEQAHQRMTQAQLNQLFEDIGFNGQGSATGQRIPGRGGEEPEAIFTGGTRGADDGHGQPVAVTNYDWTVSVPSWSDAIISAEEAEHFLKHQTEELQSLNIDGDDVVEVETHIVSYAKDLLNAVHAAPVEAPASWDMGKQQSYFKAPQTAHEYIKEHLSPSSELRVIEAICVKAVQACINVNKRGAPAAHFDPKAKVKGYGNRCRA